MKKVMKLAVVALAVVALTAACKQKNAEESIDTMVEDTTLMIEEPVVDSVVEEEVAEPVKEEVKKTTPKTQAKPADPVKDGIQQKGQQKEGTVTLTKADGTKVEAKAANPKDVTIQKADGDSKAITQKKGNVTIPTKGKK